MFKFGKKLMKTVELPKPKQAAISYSADIGTKGYLMLGNAQYIGDRTNQQDSFGYSDISDNTISTKGILAVLADGMGGLSHGKQISDFVVKSMLTGISHIIQNEPIPNQIESMIDKINHEVCENQLNDSSENAGTTLSAVYIYKKDAFWVSIGDSRIYLKRDDFIYQVSEDNNYYNQLLSDYIFNDGDIEVAKNHAQKDALTSYIGNPQLPYMDYNKKALSIQNGDEFLLCSDGVYNTLDNAEILECMKEEPQEAAEQIIKRIKEKQIKGQDNATVMLIKIYYEETN